MVEKDWQHILNYQSIVSQPLVPVQTVKCSALHHEGNEDVTVQQVHIIYVQIRHFIQAHIQICIYHESQPLG